MNTFAGECHCGALTVRFSTVRNEEDLQPRACDCTFCLRHGAAYLSDCAGRLEIVAPADCVYRFGFRITDFHVCKNCGVLVAATWRDEGGALFGVVNLHALEKADSFVRTPLGTSFDQERQRDREGRRRAHWTPAVLVLSEQ